MPIDSLSGGTWVAVNDAGLAATLLNVNLDVEPDSARERRRQSRGMLIPDLMSSATLGDARRRAAAITLGDYPPFRLVLLDRRELADFYSDGATLRSRFATFGDLPRMFASSGLGDSLVEPPRRALFNEMFGLPDGATDAVRRIDAAEDDAARQRRWLDAQHAYHRHSWPDRTHVSVCMSRDAAHTVSHTLIELAPDQSQLIYTPGAPDRAAPLPPMTLSINEEKP